MGVTPFLLGWPFLRHAAMASFDLALIDLRLPDIHGFDLLCELQTQSERLARRTPAIVVTGATDTHSAPLTVVQKTLSPSPFAGML
jgi:DNA-binding response OmpR family regulator